MFIRKKRSARNGSEYEYLQIVRSRREGHKVRQEVIATLGRADKLIVDGEVDGLLRSLAKFSDKLRVVEAARLPDAAAQPARQWGPALVFGRLWEEQRIPEILRKLSRDRKFEFDLERAAFAMALQRLCAPGSDLQGSGWCPRLRRRGSRGWRCSTCTERQRFCRRYARSLNKSSLGWTETSSAKTSICCSSTQPVFQCIETPKTNCSSGVTQRSTGRTFPRRCFA